MNNDLDLPSDHAPIAVTRLPPVVDRVSLGVRASSLGDHTVLYSMCKEKSQLNRPIKVLNINVDNFTGDLSRADIPQFVADVDTNLSQIIDILYSCASASVCVQVTPSVDVTVSRWERLWMMRMTGVCGRQ